MNKFLLQFSNDWFFAYTEPVSRTSCTSSFPSAMSSLGKSLSSDGLPSNHLTLRTRESFSLLCRRGWMFAIVPVLPWHLISWCPLQLCPSVLQWISTDILPNVASVLRCIGSYDSLLNHLQISVLKGSTLSSMTVSFVVSLEHRDESSANRSIPLRVSTVPSDSNFVCQRNGHRSANLNTQCPMYQSWFSYSYNVYVVNPVSTQIGLVRKNWLVKGTGAVRRDEEKHRHYAVGLVLDGLPTTRSSFIQHRRDRKLPIACVMLVLICLVIVNLGFCHTEFG